MKAVVAAFNQEKALVGAFSVITNLRMELFEALTSIIIIIMIIMGQRDMARAGHQGRVSAGGHSDKLAARI